MVTGLFLECGVNSGFTVNLIAAAVAPRIVHGFDSFEGLPEDWTGYRFARGAFSRNGSLPQVAGNVQLHKGYFDAVLGPFLAAQKSDISFVHMDCDLYSSTRDVLTACAPYIRTGTIMVFDEFMNYPGWQQHEFRALSEFSAGTGWHYRYISLCDWRDRIVKAGIEFTERSQTT